MDVDYIWMIMSQIIMCSQMNRNRDVEVCFTFWIVLNWRWEMSDLVQLLSDLILQMKMRSKTRALMPKIFWFFHWHRQWGTTDSVLLSCIQTHLCPPFFLFLLFSSTLCFYISNIFKKGSHLGLVFFPPTSFSPSLVIVCFFPSLMP